MQVCTRTGNPTMFSGEKAIGANKKITESYSTISPQFNVITLGSLTRVNHH